MVSHIQDSDGVELQSHILLIQAIFLLTLVVIAEFWAPNALQLWVMKAFLYMILGSWLMQIGFMLYKPISGHKWMDDDKNDIVFVTTFFWHPARATRQPPPPFRMASRGPACGLSQEVQQKIAKQYNADLEQILIQWITAQCDKDMGRPQPRHENIQNRLRDGTRCCVSALTG
ncbi:hypothetical protein QTO34_011458 [Cnephaeus nilssonii]|uniref:Uncharacterized protein n=1 Tax=Cnephaeus nilssonii TaxID=3371016 RepID=A0AA40HEE5_CNENI|nr:hypothetical protein QTO34_011458 [Eptesicus nilssonii]